MHNKKITLTIVIPAYNEENYLKACLESIFGQSELPDEVIVVDNSSTDKTAGLAGGYKGVRVLSEKRRGIVFARNTGFNAAKSELIGRIDADTVLEHNWVESIKQQYISDGRQRFYAATAPSSFQNLHSRHIWYALHRIFYFWTSRLLLSHHTLSGSNMFMTRALWLEVKDSVCVRTDVHEDMDLALHINREGVKINFIRTLKNSMVGRNVFYKLRNYPLMWFKIRLIEHSS